MASAPPTNQVQSDDEYEKYFSEFADGKSPDPVEAPPETGPEGNDPGEDDAGADAPAGPSEVDTSGEAEGGDEPPVSNEAPDPWAQVPPELRSQFDQAQRERDAALHRAKSDANRVAALSRKLASYETSAPAAGAPEKKEDTEAQKALDAKRKQLEEDYPDVATPMFEIIDGLKNELGQVQQTVGSVTAERQEAQVAAQYEALATVHPDWQTVAANPAWTEWVGHQPDRIRELATSWDARETSVALSLFKAEMGMAASQGSGEQQQPTAAAAPATGARRSAQLEGGRDVRSRPAPAASGAPDDFDAAFAHYSNKQDAKRRA